MNPSFLQRFFADTPDFFKKAHMLGLLLVAIGFGLTGIVPATYCTVIASIGGTLAVISQFAVKDIAAFTSGQPVKDALMQVLSDLPAQVAEATKDVKAVFTGQPLPGGLPPFPEDRPGTTVDMSQLAPKLGSDEPAI